MNIHGNYDIIIAFSAGIASIMTPFFRKHRNMQALMLYQTLTGFTSDPISYDAELAMFLFLRIGAYMIMIKTTMMRI